MLLNYIAVCIAKFYVVCRLNDQFSVKMAAQSITELYPKENMEIFCTDICCTNCTSQLTPIKEYIECLKRNAPYILQYVQKHMPVCADSVACFHVYLYTCTPIYQYTCRPINSKPIYPLPLERKQNQKLFFVADIFV